MWEKREPDSHSCPVASTHCAVCAHVHQHTRGKLKHTCTSILLVYKFAFLFGKWLKLCSYQKIEKEGFELHRWEGSGNRSDQNILYKNVSST